MTRLCLEAMFNTHFNCVSDIIPELTLQNRGQTELKYATVLKQLLSSLVSVVFADVSKRLRYEATDDDGDHQPPPCEPMHAFFPPRHCTSCPDF